jgi:hypothetical protein
VRRGDGVSVDPLLRRRPLPDERAGLDAGGDRRRTSGLIHSTSPSSAVTLTSLRALRMTSKRETTFSGSSSLMILSPFCSFTIEAESRG